MATPRPLGSSRRPERRRVRDDEPAEPSGDVIYGRHSVLEALRAGADIRWIRVAKGVLAQGPLRDVLKEAEKQGVTVSSVERPDLDRAFAEARGRGNHQGVLAGLGPFVYADLDTIMARAIAAGEPALVLVLDAVQDVHNLGGLIRTAEAVGAHGVVIADFAAAGVTGAVRKSSAGAVAHLPVARLGVGEALTELGARRVVRIGLSPDANVVYHAADFRGPVAVVVGGEGRGLSRSAASRSDVLVGLPMRGQVGSLNAAVAGSVVLYEVLRQRGEAARSGLLSGAGGPAQSV